MKPSLVALALLACASLAEPAAAQSETRAQYLARLKEICAAQCLEPRPFQRAARKRSGLERNGAESEDMAVIMDVADVRRNGDRFELFNLDLSTSDLETVQLLASAGVNTSSSTGIGGLPRGRGPELHPEVIVVSLDAQAFGDLLNPIAAASEEEAGEGESDSAGAAAPQRGAVGPDGRIIVEGAGKKQASQARREPGLSALRTTFRNRRIVARGTPKLTAQWVGGRIDRRNKQVTLLVDNADDLVLLPRYDENGEPILEGALAGLAASGGAAGK
ncbi:MAG: hypothetical protein V2I27_08975 [Erythrobacter sp.]|nr:hypothetical protein [Erythrobacter sp.]